MASNSLYIDAFQSASMIRGPDEHATTLLLLTQLCPEEEAVPLRPRVPNKGGKHSHDLSEHSRERHAEHQRAVYKYVKKPQLQDGLKWVPPISYSCRLSKQTALVDYYYLVAIARCPWQRDPKLTKNSAGEYFPTTFVYEKVKPLFIPWLRTLTEKVPGATFPPSLPNNQEDLTKPADEAFFKMWDTFDMFLDDLVSVEGLFPDYPRALAHLYLLSRSERWRISFEKKNIAFSNSTALFLLINTVESWTQNTGDKNVYFPPTVHFKVFRTLVDII
jgi:hypothetical protein